MDRDAKTLSVAVHHGPLKALEPSFAALGDPAHPGAAFRSFAWLSTWWKYFSDGRAPHVLLARAPGARGEPGRIVAILPMYSERRRGPLGNLRLMGDGIVGSD